MAIERKRSQINPLILWAATALSFIVGFTVARLLWGGPMPPAFRFVDEWLMRGVR